MGWLVTHFGTGGDCVCVCVCRVSCDFHLCACVHVRMSVCARVCVFCSITDSLNLSLTLPSTLCNNNASNIQFLHERCIFD